MRMRARLRGVGFVGGGHDVRLAGRGCGIGWLLRSPPGRASRQAKHGRRGQPSGRHASVAHSRMAFMIVHASLAVAGCHRHRLEHHRAALGHALGRRGCGPCTSPASWPQAASMSSPRVLRTVVTIPASLSIFAKACTRGCGERTSPEAGKRVERDQVELAGDAAAVPRAPARTSCSRVLGLVVHAIEHAVLEGDEVARRMRQVAVAGVEQFGDRVLPVERHQVVAQFVVRARAATPPARPGSRRPAGRSSAPRRRWTPSRAGATGRSRCRRA